MSVLYTIGFTKKTAEKFFTKLKQPGLVRLIDVRLKNESQLCGFSKKEDLRFFLHQINGIRYEHLPELAPPASLFKIYKRNRSWNKYEHLFRDLLAQRKIEETVPKLFIRGACLLCSEPEPDHCHRRIVAEYFQDCWGDLEIKHL